MNYKIKDKELMIFITTLLTDNCCIDDWYWDCYTLDTGEVSIIIKHNTKPIHYKITFGKKYDYFRIYPLYDTLWTPIYEKNINPFIYEYNEGQFDYNEGMNLLFKYLRKPNELK